MAFQVMIVVVIPFLMICSADGGTKSLTVSRSDREAMGDKIHEFMAMANINEEKWESTFTYADGSVDQSGSQIKEHVSEEYWPVIIEYTNLSSLSDIDAAKHNEEEDRKKLDEAEGQDQSRKDHEEKEGETAAEKDAGKAAGRETEEPRLAAEEEEHAKKKEEEERLKAEQAKKEAKEVAKNAQEAEDAAKAAALDKEAEDKRKEEEKRRHWLEDAEKARGAAEEEKARQAVEAAEALFKQEEAAKLRVVSKPRNLKWRWEEDYIPFWGMVSKATRSKLVDDTKWNQPASRDALVEELNAKAIDPEADAKSKQYKTRRVEFADVQYPERRKIFTNYILALEWLALAWNIPSKDDL